MYVIIDGSLAPLSHSETVEVFSVLPHLGVESSNGSTNKPVPLPLLQFHINISYVYCCLCLLFLLLLLLMLAIATASIYILLPLHFLTITAIVT